MSQASDSTAMVAIWTAASGRGGNRRTCLPSRTVCGRVRCLACEQLLAGSTANHAGHECSVVHVQDEQVKQEPVHAS